MSSPLDEEDKTPPSSSGKGKGKRRRRYDSEEVKMELEKAERKLNEAKEERDRAKEERDSLKTERNSRLKEYMANKGTDSEAIYRRVWEDAEESLRNAESALKTAQSAVDTLQKKVNKLSDPDVVVYSPGSSDSGSTVSFKKHKRSADYPGVLIAQCDKSELEGFSLDVRKGQKTWTVPDALIKAIGKVDGGLLPSKWKKVYIRESMKQLLDCLAVKPERTKYILGTPGIGKSLLLFLSAVSRFVEKNEPCLFLRRIADERSLFCVLMEGGALSVYGKVRHSTDLDVVLDVVDRIQAAGGKYYVDGVNPKDTSLKEFGVGSDFWVTSASHSLKDESNAEILYLSAWTEHEIKDGFNELGLSEEQAGLHYSIIGGSFRRVGEPEEELRSRMMEACKGGEIVKTDRLFHTFVTHPRWSAGYERREASEYVLEVLRAASVQSLLKTYYEIESASVQGGIFQVLTEKWMQMQSRGQKGVLVLKCLSKTHEKDADELKIEFNSVSFPDGRAKTRKSEIKGEENVMYCPTLCNFPGCDKLLFSGGVLYFINDTVGSHNCNWSTFQAAFECMRQNPAAVGCPTKVIYLVPTFYDRQMFKLKETIGWKNFEKNGVEVLVGYCEGITEFIRR